MRTEYIDLALSFLENPKDRVVIQHEYMQDRKLIMRYIKDLNLDNLKVLNSMRLSYQHIGEVFFQCTSEFECCRGYRCPVVFVPRLKSNSEWVIREFPIEDEPLFDRYPINLLKKEPPTLRERLQKQYVDDIITFIKNTWEIPEDK